MGTILTIEHNPFFQNNLIECLEIEGYRAIGATNGEIGIELARELIPDLIICNIVLPVLGGLEVLNLISIDPATAIIPFIFSTTQCEKCIFDKALNLGADGYLVKPYSIELLLFTIKNLIRSGTKRILESY